MNDRCLRFQPVINRPLICCEETRVLSVPSADDDRDGVRLYKPKPKFTELPFQEMEKRFSLWPEKRGQQSVSIGSPFRCDQIRTRGFWIRR